MILRKIKISNFRQFYGDNEMRFGISNSKKVTVVRGQNGSGKTALLNAFWWCLYNKTTEKFKKSDQLFSLKALAERSEGDVVEMSVLLEFDHGSVRYEVHRRRVVIVGDGVKIAKVKKEDIKVRVIDIATGESEINKGNPEQLVKQLLPPALAPYFFFDGENLEHMTERSKNEDLKEAVRLVLGSKVFSRASLNLSKEVRNYYIQEKKKAGGKKMAELADELEKIEKDIISIDERILHKKKEIEAQRTLYNKIQEKLRDNEVTKKTQEKFQSINDRLSHIEDEIKENAEHKARILSGKGYLVFMKPFLENAELKLEDARRKGEIPKGYKKKFIQDIIDIGDCICGTRISGNDKALNTLMKWKEKGNFDDIDEHISKISGSTSNKLREREDFISHYTEYIKKDEELDSKKTRALEEKSKALEELGNQTKELEGAENLSDRLVTIEVQRSEYERNLGALERDKTDKEALKSGLDKKLSKATEVAEKSKLANRKFELAKKLAELCEIMASLKDLRAWEDLEVGIQETFSSIAVKPFKISLSDDYKFDVKNEFGGEMVAVGESTGETQLLSLSFIGNLLRLAKKVSEDDSLVGTLDYAFTGGVYPLVIDSPFGQIDDNYRPQIIKAELDLAPQLIVFVSGSQWSDSIDSEVRPHIFSEYMLTYNKPKSLMTEDDRNLVVNIGSIKKNFVIASNDEFEYTEIEEIIHE